MMTPFVFVAADVSNLYYTLRLKFAGKKLNYKYLMDECAKHGQIVHAIAYAAQINDQASKFFDCLSIYGFDLKIKTPKQYNRNNGQITRKADHDVGIAVDMIRHCEKVHTIVLCTGDGDIVPAVEYVRSRGCRVIVYGSQISGDLKLACDKAYEISPAFLEVNNEEAPSNEITTSAK